MFIPSEEKYKEIGNCFSNKITMYELLGLVKDGKELPKKVKVLDVIYEFDDHYGDYFNEELDRYLFVYMTSEEEWKLAYFLNAQVEILEEEKKIPEKLPIGIKQTKDGIFNTIVKDNIQYELNEKEEIICKKIHEIIDYLKSKGDK